MSHRRWRILLAVAALSQGMTDATAREQILQPRVPTARSATSQDVVPKGWLSQAQRSIQLAEYRVAEVGDRANTFRAANPAQHFESRFNAQGVRLQSSDEAAWEWGLTLIRWGRPGAQVTVTDGRVSARDDRVELDREKFAEWFVNTPDGLEHGFTIPAPPDDAEGSLVFELGLQGGLRPVFHEDGQAVDFYGSGSLSVLRYSKLFATDATGEALVSRMESMLGGIRIVVDDAGATYPITIDPLASTSSWTASGEATQDYFGWSVTTAGDINADGYFDVLVGAYPNASQRGKAYLYMGGPGGLSTSPAWTAIGEATSNQFGYSVSTAGDVNGDGYSDVIIGAPLSSTGRGKAYLYLGGFSGLGTSPSWTAIGEATSNQFGYSVSTAGDVNGDGYSDVIIGAPLNTTSRGKAYLYLGGPSGLATSASWSAAGLDANARFGYAVATAGDTDGNGFSEVVVGAPFYDAERGMVQVFTGTESGLYAFPSWYDFGDAAGVRLGTSVATAGDVNGDGLADLLVGAPFTENLSGKAFLYLGGSEGLSFISSWAAVGENPGDALGQSVATAGDVNGDGYTDVIVGTHGYANFTGAVRLFLGGPGGLGIDPSQTLLGEASIDQFGLSVAPAGDANGDGYSDIIVGAFGVSSFAGRAYLYLGGSDTAYEGISWSATGESTNDLYGGAVAMAGDVNGDGYSDLLAGARLAEGSGKAYLYLGGPGGPGAGFSWAAAGEGSDALFGAALATAGDINGDGYSDVVIGAPGHAGLTGRAQLYLGGPSGLGATATWSASGEAVNDQFGAAVATAGDINGDGYSDLVIGAPGNAGGRGKAYLYMGGPGGLRVVASWTAVGEAAGDLFGVSVAGAGDMNGDGFADVVVGAPGHSAATGRAYLFHGGPATLSAGAPLTYPGLAAGESFGHSVSTAGDLNRDGFSDVIVGANGFFTYIYLGRPAGANSGTLLSSNSGGSVANAGDVDNNGYSDVLIHGTANPPETGSRVSIVYSGPSGWTQWGPPPDLSAAQVATAGDMNGDGFSDVVIGVPDDSASTGMVRLHFGGGGPGLPVRPRQLRYDQSAPIMAGGPAHMQRFRLGLTLRSPVGRVARILQWKLVPWGGFPSLRNAPIQTDAQWFDSQVNRTIPIYLPEDYQRYVWRARVKYHPAQSPFVGWSPWFTIPDNGLQETDLFSTSLEQPPACEVPDEQPYISLVTLDLNGKPTLHYMDANQPAVVTGYNVYRSLSPLGPWIMISSDAIDMDDGTPNLQFVDQTGDVGGTWYYKVTAFNDACDAEGPF